MYPKGVYNDHKLIYTKLKIIQVLIEYKSGQEFELKKTYLITVKKLVLDVCLCDMVEESQRIWMTIISQKIIKQEH